MKKLIISFLGLISIAALAITNSADVEKENDYIAHEWGTFTAVSGSDGELLDGLFLEEERLPGFVHEIPAPFDMMGFKFRGNGIPEHHLRGVNIKMETPVIYIYSDKEREVDVNVKFKGGIVNQWYPNALNNRQTGVNVGPLKIQNLQNLDFRKSLEDSIDWKVKVLSPDSHLSYTSKQNLETPTWVNPRFVDANMLQIGKDREKFIFYRGLARFEQPFKVTAQSSSQITLQNTGNDEIGFAMVYEYTKDNKAKVWWTGKLDGNEKKIVNKKELDVDKSIHKEFLDGLVEAGLYKKEAKSMLETWRHSYFEKEGLRVFWIVPRKFTDEILPIKLKPAPKKLERVLVGRTEVLTPEFEEKLVKDFTTNANHSPYWFYSQNTYGKADRYFKAWQNRVVKILDEQPYKFAFLKQVTEHYLKPGEFYLQKDEKDKSLFMAIEIGNFRNTLTYREKNGNIDGQVTYLFFEEKIETKGNMNLIQRLPREAEFNMKNGKLDGECKIFDTSIKDKKVLLETKIFKDGKIL